MSRNVLLTSIKPKTVLDSSNQICADCGATEAEWASINRGVLVCSDCCSVHRSLGRHVSQIKGCQDRDWHPHTWNLVCALSNGGANSVWEHTLLDPTLSKTAKRKPSPTDPVHPVKADFIRAKHQMLSFIIQPPPSHTPIHNQTATTTSTTTGGGGGVSGGVGDDEGGEDWEVVSEGGEEEEASQELHSSVRTGNLETSLRLLSQGADPNYYYKTRGNHPLHVAAASGQAEQVELLLVYGASSQCLDSASNTPAQAASAAGHTELAARLTSVQYELVYRLRRYLSDQHTNTTPHSQPYRHSSDPDDQSSVDGDTVADSNSSATPLGGGGVGNATTKPSGYPSTDSASWFVPPHLLSAHQHATEQARQARAKLIKMSVVLLAELAADLYDEVDRRELEVLCCGGGGGGGGGERCTVPFLPVNPLLSSTRNQARQKLARLKEGEFCSLIVDLLVEAKRKAAIVSPSGASAATSAAADRLAEDEPLYDSVCSEDDYSLVEQLQRPSSQPEVGSVKPAAAGGIEADYQQIMESSVDDDAQCSVPTISVNASNASFSNDACGTTDQQNQRNTAPVDNSAHNTNREVSSLATSKDPPDKTNDFPDSSPRAESHIVVVSSTLSSSQQHLITSTPVPPSLSPSLSTITHQQQQQHPAPSNSNVISMEQFELMKRNLESSEKHINQLREDNRHMRSQLDQLSSTLATLRRPPASPAWTATSTKVSKLREENSSLRNLATPSPPSDISPTIYQTPYQSLPPLHNGDASLTFNQQYGNDGRGFVSMPYKHHRSDSYPTYSEPSSTHNLHHHHTNNTSSSSFSATPSPRHHQNQYPPNSMQSPPHSLQSNPPQYEYPTRPGIPKGRYSTSYFSPSLTNTTDTNTPSGSTNAVHGNAYSLSSNKSVVGNTSNRTSNVTAAGAGFSSMPTRPVSMFETRDQRGDKDLKNNLRRDARVPSGSTASHNNSCHTYESICNSSEWDGDATNTGHLNTSNTTTADSNTSLCGCVVVPPSPLPVVVPPPPQYERSASFSDEMYGGVGGGGARDSVASSTHTSRYHTPHQSMLVSDMPSSGEIAALTEPITQAIRDLFTVVPGTGDSSSPLDHRQQLVRCANRVNSAVQCMVAAYPRSGSSRLPPSIHDALITLVHNTRVLSGHCEGGSSRETLIQTAFAIAQAAKNLVRASHEHHLSDQDVVHA